MVNFIWQHNSLVRSYGTLKMRPRRLDFWCSKVKKRDPPSPCNSKTKRQRSEPKWLLKYFITPNVCAKFQPDRLTTSFGPWNTFSNTDTFALAGAFLNRLFDTFSFLHISYVVLLLSRTFFLRRLAPPTFKERENSICKE